MTGGSRKTNIKEYMRRKELRRTFSQSCELFRLQGCNPSFLCKRVKVTGTIHWARVALRSDVNDQLFRKYYDRVVLGEFSKTTARQALLKYQFFPHSSKWWCSQVKRFDANQRTFFTVGNPGAEVIVSKAALSFKCCFDDAADGRVRSDGFVSNGRNKRPSLPKSLGQMTHFKGLNIFKRGRGT